MIKTLRRAILGIALLSIPFTMAAAPQVYTLTVDGLACPFCAYGIEKQIKALDGVETIEIDIDEGHVVVTVAEDAVLAEADFRQAVEDAGFTLRGLKVTEVGQSGSEKGDG